ncbi:uncharacterized protein TNCV_2141431 [Trichonephila clavipes]|uniref:Uncharacterized protein n=1 Tax=Trichonephila clavipes TaxID=2585209 RepID=A0A8X6RV31_TRICX|nr:uncharacterized protein TNCV_2141431 [Trichonephila clavipes]
MISHIRIQLETESASAAIGNCSSDHDSSCRSSVSRPQTHWTPGLLLTNTRSPSRRAASPLVRLVEGKERWEVSDHPQHILPEKWGETELNCFVPCMVLKATVNDRHHLALYHDKFRGP